MKVRDAMSTDIALVSPDETIQEAARAMATRDVGALPVGESQGCGEDQGQDGA